MKAGVAVFLALLYQLFDRFDVGRLVGDVRAAAFSYSSRFNLPCLAASIQL